MKRMTAGALAAAAACTIGATAAGPAQAASTQGCGGNWGDGRNACTFNYDGGGILVRINKAGGVFGSVRLVSGEGASWRVYLVRDALVGPCVMATYSPEDLFPIGTQLSCLTQGVAGTGRFECVSGEELSA